MDNETARYVIDLEGRVIALSGMLALLIWVLRQRGVMDPDLEHQLYASASAAVAGFPPGMEAAADRLILAMQSAANPLPVKPASPHGGFSNR